MQIFARKIDDENSKQRLLFSQNIATLERVKKIKEHRRIYFAWSAASVSSGWFRYLSLMPNKSEFTKFDAHCAPRYLAIFEY